MQRCVFGRRGGLCLIVSALLCLLSSIMCLTSRADPVYTEPVGAVKIEVIAGDYTQVNIPLIVDEMSLNDLSDTIVCVGEMLR